MIVIPISRMLSAISFGVFCRSAPSTSRIMRSRKVEPGAAVILTLIQSDRTCVPPVTAERSPPDSRMTGADSPVIAASFTVAMPSITSPSDGMVSPASTSTTSPTFRLVPETRPIVLCSGVGQQLGLRLRALLAQRIGLRLAAPFGNRLGKIGEQHGDPQPDDDLEGEAEILAAHDHFAQEDDGRQRGDDLHHEHHRVLDHEPAGRAWQRPRQWPARRSWGRATPKPACACGLSRFPWMQLRDDPIRTSASRASRNVPQSARARAPGRR